MQSQAAFAKAQELNFHLLSDPDGSVAAKFGVPLMRGLYPKRITFIIDADGVLRHIDKKIDVKTHGAKLNLLIEDLRK